MIADIDWKNDHAARRAQIRVFDADLTALRRKKNKSARLKRTIKAVNTYKKRLLRMEKTHANTNK